jgi:acyl carrier protein
MAEASKLASGGLKGAAPVFKTFQGNALEQNRAVSPAKENDGAKTLIGCGQTWRDVRVAIVHRETLARCHPDEVGEIWVSGGSIAQGYWNQPDETQRVFQAFLTDTGEGPFLRTGDLGFVDNGELFVTGRIKDLIIIRGRNHYPQDIEQTVEQSHPALREGCSAAFSVDVNMEERLVVVVEVDRQHLRNLDRDAVIKCIRQAVTEQHDLEIYTIWLLKTGSIPKTSSGKIQHHACRRSFLNNSLDVVGDWTINPARKTEFQNFQPEVISLEQQLRDSETQPSSADNRKNEQPTCYNVFEQSEAIAAWLVSKITEHLKISNNEIDIREPFSVYGLDSISIVNLSGQLENWLGCRVSPTVLYDYPTIEALAQHLEAIQREALLAKVDHLSEEEVDLLLQKLLKKESY